LLERIPLSPRWCHQAKAPLPAGGETPLRGLMRVVQAVLVQTAVQIVSSEVSKEEKNKQISSLKNGSFLPTFRDSHIIPARFCSACKQMPRSFVQWSLRADTGSAAHASYLDHAFRRTSPFAGAR